LVGFRLQLFKADLVEQLLPVARAAGKAILEIYATDFAVTRKSDASPVTEADDQAEAIIISALETITPDIPIVSEEAASAGHIPKIGTRFWLVDPLDGTKEFIGRNGEFTVNIGLIENLKPSLGIVFAPALDRMFAGVEGGGAFLEDSGKRQPIACRRPPDQGLTVVASRSYGDAAALDGFLAGRKVASRTTAGSSLKLCLVAAGEADIYPRLGRTMEWDIAAGHAILKAAGGRVRTLDGAELAYGKPDFANPHFFAAGLE
jgi:3'(2'), 5'-bisphosphate nucleotidase